MGLRVCGEEERPQESARQVAKRGVFPWSAHQGDRLLIQISTKPLAALAGAFVFVFRGRFLRQGAAAGAFRMSPESFKRLKREALLRQKRTSWTWPWSRRARPASHSGRCSSQPKKPRLPPDAGSDRANFLVYDQLLADVPRLARASRQQGEHDPPGIHLASAVQRPVGGAGPGSLPLPGPCRRPTRRSARRRARRRCASTPGCAAWQPGWPGPPQYARS